MAKNQNPTGADVDMTGPTLSPKQDNTRHVPSGGVALDKALAAGVNPAGTGGAMPTGVHKGAQSTYPGFDDSSKMDAADQSTPAEPAPRPSKGFKVVSK